MDEDELTDDEKTEVNAAAQAYAAAAEAGLLDYCGESDKDKYK